MQNKLNEILDLCIEKSNNDVFYVFHYSARNKLIFIEKENGAGSSVKFKNRQSSTIYLSAETDIDQALEYMQNE